MNWPRTNLRTVLERVQSAELRVVSRSKIIIVQHQDRERSPEWPLLNLGQFGFTKISRSDDDQVGIVTLNFGRNDFRFATEFFIGKFSSLLMRTHMIESKEPNVFSCKGPGIRKIDPDFQFAIVQDGSHVPVDIADYRSDGQEREPWTIGQFHGLIGGVRSFLSSTHLADINQKQTDSDKDGKFFPKWGLVFAPIGAAGIWWSWDNIRSERRVCFSLTVFVASAILWMYGLARLITL